ncbi:amino acid adenylation domain-containing protein [Micromonospora echinospora]|uniref:Amino acid adenylation domain-containing protein n=1 Tax=Micromonospora echinospora TaxID=1877 RepID=A0A1C4YSD7_MICEC|nr:amino acid adenylation domain-containing protein [Micromonospora echinospora]SCF23574.1 amino acid adenylation domain-containing protein [Micromonospora echinospora]
MYRSLPEWFLAICARHPERTAVVCGSEHLTYQELAAEARGLAAELIRRGVTRGDLVGLRVTRSMDIPVAVIGILLAGGAYVPLDPGYPSQRLRRIIAETSIGCVVGETLPARGHTASPRTDLPEVSAGDRAYVIYTSGSTGQPKGCVISHGNVLSLHHAALPLLDVGPDDRWTLFSSINFDVSVWELWSALGTGATLVIVDAEAVYDPEVFLRLIIDQRVTVLNAVPPVFRLLAEAHADAGRPPLPLRYVIFAGDAVDLDTTAAFIEGLPQRIRPINMYGITETTVHATFKELDDTALHGVNRSPIGRPLPHLEIMLRDPTGEPVPDGQAGEIWVSGSGVGLGYHGRDDLTAERFLTVDGVRSYRSGDLARRLPDGELEYLGRADRQVKLRGFRIELPEIEATLRGCTGVRDAVVELVTGHVSGDFLAAYLVVDHTFDTRRIRQECAEALPPYMVPTTYKVLPAIPLTPSGKIDRSALTAHR